MTVYSRWWIPVWILELKFVQDKVLLCAKLFKYCKIISNCLRILRNDERIWNEFISKITLVKTFLLCWGDDGQRAVLLGRKLKKSIEGRVVLYVFSIYVLYASTSFQFFYNIKTPKNYLECFYAGFHSSCTTLKLCV